MTTFVRQQGPICHGNQWGGSSWRKILGVQNTRTVAPMVSETRVAPGTRTHDRGGGGGANGKFQSSGGEDAANFKSVGGKIYVISRQ